MTIKMFMCHKQPKGTTEGLFIYIYYCHSTSIYIFSSFLKISSEVPEDIWYLHFRCGFLSLHLDPFEVYQLLWRSISPRLALLLRDFGAIISDWGYCSKAYLFLNQTSKIFCSLRQVPRSLTHWILNFWIQRLKEFLRSKLKAKICEFIKYERSNLSIFYHFFKKWFVKNIVIPIQN